MEDWTSPPSPPIDELRYRKGNIRMHGGLQPKITLFARNQRMLQRDPNFRPFPKQEVKVKMEAPMPPKKRMTEMCAGRRTGPHAQMYLARLRQTKVMRNPARDCLVYGARPKPFKLLH